MSQTKILVVGDEALAASELAGNLRNGGYEVAGITSSGEEALEEVGKVRPDLVLLDIRLKGELDGVETAGRIYRDFNVPVIFLAEYADAETLDQAKTAEPFGYLTKPYRTVDLAGAITIALLKHSVEQKLRERESWLTVALSSAGDGVIVTDATGRIAFLNPLAKQILSVPDVEVTGLKCSDVIRLQSKITGAPAGDLVQLAILQGATMDAGKDLVVTSASGERREVEGEVAVCRVDDAIIGTVFTFRDVTLRNRREEQFRQEIRSQAVAQLAGAISNQVGALLQTALKHSDAALSGIEADHQVRGSLEALKTRVEDLSRIAKQLFTLSTNTVSFPRVMDLNATVSETCSVLRHDLPPGVELVTDLSSDLGEIRADPLEITRAIVRLAVHTGAGTPEGGAIKIQTRNYALERRDREGETERYVSLTISDTGPERPGEDARGLFDPFFQSDGSGLDLGLFLVHGIITDSHGSITARTNSEGGTTFEILLPQAAVSGNNASPSESLAYPEGQEAAIVLVESDAGIRNLIGSRLEREGYELLGAANYAEAMSWLERYDAPIAMLITNLVMPGKSGPDLAQKFLLERPALSIVFISDGPVDPALEATWVSRGAGFVEKPFEQEELVRVVHEAFEKAEAGARVLTGGATMN